MKLKSLLLSASMFVFAACGSDDGGGGTTKFASKTEADAALASNQAYIALGYSNAGTAASLAKSFAPAKALALTYNASTGFWTDETSAVSNGITTHYIYKYRFTPRDANGKATAATTTLDYIIDYSYTGTSSGVTFDYKYLYDVTTTGVSGYRAGTGDLTINGAWDYNLDYSYVITGYNGSFVYDMNYTFTKLVYGTGTYPKSGSISFTTKYSNSNAQSETGNYNVAGKLTFDGSNIAILEFGGFTYSYNLQTGVIS